MNVLIVDDDSLVCKSLQALLSKEPDIEVVDLAYNGEEAISKCEQVNPDIVLMDIRMPKLNGIQATRKIKETNTDVQVIMLTTFQDDQNIRLALLAGASGYLLKSAEIETIAQKIRAVHSGSSVMDTQVLKELTSKNDFSITKLTEREQHISRLVGEGLTNKEIAHQLFISEGTVRNNLSVILEKLELENRTQLAIYYWRKIHS